MFGLTKWAKYGVLAMVVADAIGIMVVHHRLNQPAANLPSLANDSPIAIADTQVPLPNDALRNDALPKDVLAKDNLQVTDVVAQMDSRSLPAVTRIDPLPAPMSVEPLALDTPQASPRVVRAMTAALRAPVIPTVRIAELRPAHRATHSFTTAFSSDISAATQSSRQAPTASYAAPSAATDAVDMSPTTNISSDIATPTDAQNTTVQSPSAVPVPEFGVSSQSSEPQVDQQPTPAAPETSVPATSEIPAS